MIPSGLLPSRSVGPEPGTTTITGAPFPASISVPASGPAGPGTVTSAVFSAMGAAPIAAASIIIPIIIPGLLIIHSVSL